MKEELLSLDVERVVLFEMDNTEYAVPINEIFEIYDLRKTIKVPLAPPFINKIATIRGNVITVFDINLFLFSKLVQTSEESRIIVIEDNDLKIGILVSRIKNIEYISKNNIFNLKNDEVLENKFKFSDEIFKSEFTEREINIINSKKVLDYVRNIDIV